MNGKKSGRFRAASAPPLLDKIPAGRIVKPSAPDYPDRSVYDTLLKMIGPGEEKIYIIAFQNLI
jgi:hypothetical protein